MLALQIYIVLTLEKNETKFQDVDEYPDVKLAFRGVDTIPLVQVCF